MGFLSGFEFRENKTVKDSRKFLRYVIAICTPLILFGIIQIPYLSFVKSSATLVFMSGVVLSSWNGGLKPGILTSFLSAGLLIYYFTQPYGIEVFQQINGVSKFILFALEGTLISYIIDVVGKRKEIEKYKTNIKELKEKNETLYRQNSDLQKELRSRDEFLSIASHELKTPLTSMLLQTQHALHNIRNVSLAHFSIESLLKMLESVENQTKRLSKMINDFLNISLINTGNLQLEYDDVDLNKLVQDVINEFSPKIKEEQYVLTYEQEDKVRGIWDKVRIEQVISNILSNALKYGSGKPIEVTVRNHYSRAQIMIKDHGIGVPKDKQKKVFQLFERGVPQDQYKGLGVGLFITHEIVKAHHGELLFTSRPNHGSIFTINLPLRPSEQSNSH